MSKIVACAFTRKKYAFALIFLRFMHVNDPGSQLNLKWDISASHRLNGNKLCMGPVIRRKYNAIISQNCGFPYLNKSFPRLSMDRDVPRLLWAAIAEEKLCSRVSKQSWRLQYGLFADSKQITATGKALTRWTLHREFSAQMFGAHVLNQFFLYIFFQQKWCKANRTNVYILSLTFALRNLLVTLSDLNPRLGAVMNACVSPSITTLRGRDDPLCPFIFKKGNLSRPK